LSNLLQSILSLPILIRVQNMTDADALAIADVLDWWIGRAAQAQKMRTLRQALAEESREHAPRLFRLGGAGKPTIWLGAEEIERLRGVLTGAITPIDCASVAG
jgi:hypothetical protein